MASPDTISVKFPEDKESLQARKAESVQIVVPKGVGRAERAIQGGDWAAFGEAMGEVKRLLGDDAGD